MPVKDLGSALHLHGVILPDDEPRDLWIRDGVVTFEKVPGAVTIVRDVFVLAGLVDAHCHIGLGVPGAMSRAETQAQAEADLATGVMLVRDAGSPADTRWIDEREDLPRIVRAGQHIARAKRYIRNLPVEVEPEQLVAEAQRQAHAGDGWIKLVGDWIDRSTGDLDLLWPADVLAEAVQAAQATGAKVTAHCFAEESVEVLINAGIDCIEHGTGLSADLIDVMAQRGTALVPTYINLNRFPFYAEPAKDKYPTYYRHMHDLYDRRRETIGAAIEAGVPVYAGTDAGTVVPHGSIHDEIQELAQLGGAEFALGAASWRAREWLGQPSLTEGAPADLIVCAVDPRLDVAALRQPQIMLLGGKRVVPPGKEMPS